MNKNTGVLIALVITLAVGIGLAMNPPSDLPPCSDNTGYRFCLPN